MTDKEISGGGICRTGKCRTKVQGWKMQDWKITDNIKRVENAGLQLADKSAAGKCGTRGVVV